MAAVAGCDRTEAPSPAPATLPADHPSLAPAGATAPRPAPDTVLATAGGASVTVGDLDDAIRAMPAADRLEYASAEMVRDLLDVLIDRRLAAARGLAPLPEVPPVTGERVAAHYRANAASFVEPRRVLATRVMAATAAEAAAVRAELARGAGPAVVRARPDVLAVDQVWLQELPRRSPVLEAALALRPGEVSPVLTLPGAWLVMRADQAVPARQRALEEVRAGIAAALAEADAQQAAAARRAALRGNVAVVIDDAALMSYRAPPDGAP